MSAGFDRRTLLRVGVGAASAVAVGRGVVNARKAPTSTSARASVLDSCTGCTGCALICPTAAIVVVPGGIEIDNAACVQCGYCAALCPVNGIRVHTVVST